MSKLTGGAGKAHADWITKLGIEDAASGASTARAARDRLLAAGQEVLGGTTTITTAHVVFQGLLARAQGLHEGAVTATETDNPYAAFTLIRAYAENAAAVLYVSDHPGQLDNFWRDRDGRGVKIGRITNHAVTRLTAFRAVYEELSRYAHPHSLSLLASIHSGDANTFEWRSEPAFKSEADRVVAYAWIVELAEATSHLLIEMADKFGLRLMREGASFGTQVR